MASAGLWSSVDTSWRSSALANQVTLRLPKLRLDQSTIVRHPAKVKVVAMGRRWGKTVMGGDVGLACASQGARVGWVVPTYRNGRPLWKWAEQAVAPLRSSRLVHVNRAERLIEFSSHGFLGLYSADNPDAIRGEHFDVLVVDEAARILEEVWQAVLQPTLADLAGRAYLISTPRGRDWFYQEYLRGLADGNEQMSWNAPTLGNPNANIQAAYYRAQQRVSQRTFLQEWEAQFVEWEGVVFRLVDQLSVLAPREEAVAQHRYVAGLDWGKQHDYTVLSVIDATTGEQVYLDRFNVIDYEVQLTRIQGAHQRFQFEKILAEANAMGIPLIERCARLDLPVEAYAMTNASKALLVDGLSLGMETQKVKLLNDPVQREELAAFEGTRLPSGLTRYAAPEGKHDDTVVALMLAWQAATIPEAAGIVGDDIDIHQTYQAPRGNKFGLQLTRTSERGR